MISIDAHMMKNLTSLTDSESDDHISEDASSIQSNHRLSLRKPSYLTTRRKFLLGLVIVCVIAISWVASTQTAKSSFNTGFKSPFFVMYFGTAWMMLVFPLTLPLFFLTGRGSWDWNGVKELWKYVFQ